MIDNSNQVVKHSTPDFIFLGNTKMSNIQAEEIKKLKTSLDGISEASRRIGICGLKILREINLSLSYPSNTNQPPR